MSILTIGLNHKTAPLEIRERASISYSQLMTFADSLIALPAVYGCSILSTCNRTEIYAHVSDPDLAAKEMVAWLAGVAKISSDDLYPHLYIKADKEAIHHLFSVAGGLDSMILGESQIQGQVQEAYQNSLDLGLSDSVINTLFMNALTVGKRVRTETQIDRQAVSISSAAVELAMRFFSTLDNKQVCVLGAGETSELTSRHLISHGISSIMVANRTHERALWLAEEIGGHAILFQDFFVHLEKTDLIISSTASPHYLLTKDMLEPHLKDRERPLLIIDIAVPRDIDPALADLACVTLFDIDDLQNQVASNLAYRQQEAVKAKAIVEEEEENFLFWLDTLWVVPTIVKMQDQIQAIKESEIRKAKNRIQDITPREEQIIEKLANGIVSRWMHGPMINLKKLAATGQESLSCSSQRDCYLQAVTDILGISNDQTTEED